MSSPDRNCESVEERLSALLDGELAPVAAAEALEHAFGCASCREFFLAAKRLQSLTAELAVLAPVDVVEPGTPRRLGAGSMRPFLRAAALVTIGLGGGWILSGSPFAAAGSGPAVAQPMTEQRFVALASELMAAEPSTSAPCSRCCGSCPRSRPAKGSAAPTTPATSEPTPSRRERAGAPSDRFRP